MAVRRAVAAAEGRTTSPGVLIIPEDLETALNEVQ
jgi:hypothetical protein